MNILLLSVGTRNLIVRYFKNALAGSGRVIAADMSPLAPGIYEADAYYLVPPITEPGYIDILLEICRKEKIRGVLSLIDPELSLLALHRAEFEAAGSVVIGSDYEACELSFDKMRMYRFCAERGFRAARSWADLPDFRAAAAAGEARFPVFVKPRCGSASVAVSRAGDMETVELLFSHAAPGSRLMIQEFLSGQEIGADVYIDMISGEVVSIFTKKKLLMRAGETDKAVSFRDEALFSLIEDFVKAAGYRGQIDIDLFEINGEYWISEVNPRFGGGYPHAYAAGADHMALILENLRGRANRPSVGAYEAGLVMMKHSEITVKRSEESGI